MIVGVHIFQTSNIGDAVSCPLDYFDDLNHGSSRTDFSEDVFSLYDDLIFGGGGLLCGDVLAPDLVYGSWINKFRIVPKHPARKLIVWGAGLNIGGMDGADYGDWLSRFDLIGLRDFGNPWNYVPCASCMHPAFDEFAVKEGFGVALYHNHAALMADIESPSQRTNKGGKSDMPEVLRFLSGAETIITNSFHGAYWSLLLGKKVVLYRVKNIRFRTLRPILGIADQHNWREHVNQAVPAFGFLEECRRLNHQFANKVRALLNL